MSKQLFLLLALIGGCTGPDETTDDSGDTEQSPLAGLGLSPFDPTLTVGDSVQFEAKAFYENTDTAELGGEVRWQVEDKRILSISDSGQVEALATGTTSVIGTYEDRTAKVNVTVRGEADLANSVALTPASLSLVVGDTAQAQAVGTYEDGSTGNITGSCSWSSNNAGVANHQGQRCRGESD